MTTRLPVTPIVLVGLAVAAGAYAYLFDRGSISDADREARRRDVFPSFRIGEVSHLELTHGAEALTLERDAEGGLVEWQMTSPRRERADAGAVDALLRELESATRLRDVDADAAAFGPPRATGRVVIGPLQYRFALGADAPRPEGAAYLRVEGEGTFVVDRPLVVQLLRGADAYRDPRLVGIDEGDIARVEVTSAAGFVLERKGAAFRLGAHGLRASRDAAEHLLAALTEARADSFLGDGDDSRLAPDAATVTIGSRDGKTTVRLRVGGACPGQTGSVVVVRLAPAHLVACTSRGLSDAASTPPSSLADLSPFFAHADEMEDLRLEPVGGKGPIVDVARRGSGWHERLPDDRDLSADESDSASGLAASLADARGSDVHAPADGERFVPAFRVTATRTGSSVTEVVEIAALDGSDAVLARRADDGALLRLPRALAHRFEPHVIALRARSLWAPAPDTDAVTAVDDTCSPLPQRLERRAGTWQLRAPAGLPADSLAPSDLADAFVRAKADAWVSEADDGSFGLSDPSACTVTLTVAPAGDAQARALGVRFGGAAPGGYYAKTLDDPTVFVAPGVLRDLASHPAVDRSRFRVDPCDLASVAVARHGIRRTVTCADEAREPLAGPLAALYAEMALHTGATGKDEGFDAPTFEVFALKRPDAGSVETHVLVGAPTTVDGVDGYFARVAGLDATFLLPKKPVDEVISSFTGDAGPSP